MPAYDSKSFHPPAPVALVTVRSLESQLTVSDVPLLIDSGADISCLPRESIAGLVDIQEIRNTCEIAPFDGTMSVAPVAKVEVEFLGKVFRRQFLLVEGQYGFIGRNILNNVKLLLDGPSSNWSECP